LLRLLLPLAQGHRADSAAGRHGSPCGAASATEPPPGPSVRAPLVATTGGVYKHQGRNRCRLMTCAY